LSGLLCSQLNAARNLLRLTGGRGIDRVGGTGHNALTMACSRGHAEMVSLLIDYGANVCFETPRGGTPLIEAAKGNFLSLAMMLIQRGAVVHYRSKHRLNASDWAIRAGHRFVQGGCVTTEVSYRWLLQDYCPRARSVDCCGEQAAVAHASYQHVRSRLVWAPVSKLVPRLVKSLCLLQGRCCHCRPSC
jgi:hypothetical protein